MRFRKAAPADAAAIMGIIDQAKRYLRRVGIDQWQSGYPDRETVDADVASGNAYVVEDGGAIVATVTVSFDGEPSYDAIECGAWRSGGAYAVVHRMAVADGSKGTGLPSFMQREIEALCAGRGVSSIKVDTHPDNRVMNGFLLKAGFEYCGVIMFEGSGKSAYEKLLGRRGRSAFEMT